MINLGSLNGSGNSVASGINDEGDIVGYSDNVAFLYVNGHMLDLSTLLPSNSGWSNVTVGAINDAGQIAGTGYLSSQETELAFVISDVLPAPEPSTILIFGIGLLGVAIRIRIELRGRGGDSRWATFFQYRP